MVEREKHSELYIANSRLSIAPVTDLEWSFCNERDFHHDTELWLNDVEIKSETFETLKVVIKGDGWNLQMKASDEDFMMKVQDLEIPYLYLQK